MADIEITLAERNKTHGDYNVQATLSQSLKALLYKSPNWQYIPPVIKDALEMVLVKISRICCGSWKHIDSYEDSRGYLQLAENNLKDLDHQERI